MADGIGTIKPVDELLKHVEGKVKDAISKAVARCGLHCMREAKANAPRSPTMKQRSTTLVRKRRTKQKSTAGQLEKSIQYDAYGNTATVFVAQNAYCKTAKGYNYAKRIHDEKGVSWFKRGAGTIAKGARADDKFIERAVKDNVGRYEKLISDAVAKVLANI